MDLQTTGDEEQLPPVRTLTADQRRVLGALLEKAFTTPDAYPLTLKALATACSQKSNRDPVRDYSEDAVADRLHELQGLGLVAEVHTDGGRTPRYRHLVRKRFPFSEAQLAIITELWLRGRQQMGELRTRASRMASIDSQEDLRAALQPLLAEGYVQASGALERRGVEVDHGFRPETERSAAWSPLGDTESPAPPVRSTASANVTETGLLSRLEALANRVEELDVRVRRLEDQLSALTG